MYAMIFSTTTAGPSMSTVHSSAETTTFSSAIRKKRNWTPGAGTSPSGTAPNERNASRSRVKLDASEASQISARMSDPPPPNDPAQLPGRWGRQYTMKSRDAGPVWCSASFGDARHSVKDEAGSGGSRLPGFLPKSVYQLRGCQRCWLLTRHLGQECRFASLESLLEFLGSASLGGLNKRAATARLQGHSRTLQQFLEPPKGQSDRLLFRQNDPNSHQCASCTADANAGGNEPCENQATERLRNRRTARGQHPRWRRTIKLSSGGRAVRP
jgi:hypothetical protein